MLLPRERWLRRTQAMSKVTRPTLLPSARALSVWSEAVPSHLALAKYRDGEELSETELYELVEYGLLTIVGPEWLTEVDPDVPTQAVYDHPAADEPSGDGPEDAAEGAEGGHPGVDGDEPGSSDVESDLGYAEHAPFGARGDDE